ncbi:MAG: prepilin-type N-terminal cleavage/methylation domain-containing protein [Fibrobacteres bacterium]|nr:prepilin-type N-terminal cleavage/methylation domain-containing protein [Fibrobacterota bacterium]
MGVTLIELLIAISLSAVVILLALSLFKDVGFAARLTGGRRDAAFEAHAAFASLTGNLMTGRGIQRLAEGEAVLRNRRNRRVTYAWSDSVLKANGVPYKFTLASLRIEPSGPVRPAWKAFSGEMPWELDSLDGNGDGHIDFSELDRNGDGELGVDECRFIATLRVTLVASFRGIPIVMTCLVHPRNRASGPVPGDPDTSYETSPEEVPEP